jgi:hypothetical protein
VSAQWVIFRASWVIKILLRVAPHSKPFHQTPGTPVCRHGISDNLVEADSSESIIDHGAGGFKRVTLPPIRMSKSPSYLDRWSEGCLVRNPIQANRTDQTNLTWKLDRPLAEAVFVVMRLHLHDPGVTCGPVHGQKHLHNNRIIGHSGKRLTITVTPFAQQEAWCS